MGNLSNLYVSKSFQSLIHLGSDNVATPSLTTLQDGYGNSIGIEVNTAGDLFLSGSLTASLQQGYIYVGNASGKTSAFATSSLVTNIDTGSLVTTSSFNSYTSSNNQRVSSLEAATASYATSAITASSLVTASVSGTTMTFTKGNGTTFNVTLPTGSGGGTINTGSFATTGSNTFVGANNFSSSIDVIGGINMYQNGLFMGFPKNMGDPFDTNIFISTPRIVGQSASGNNLILAGDTMNSKGVTILNSLGVTGSVVISKRQVGMSLTGGDLDVAGTFTSSLQQGYVWVGDSSGRTTTVATSSFGGGGTINTGSFAITGSNLFRGNQTIAGNVRLSGSNDNHIYINRQSGQDVLRLGVSDNDQTWDFTITGSSNQQVWLIDNQGGTYGNAFFGFIQAEGRTTINAPFTASQGAQINGGNLRVNGNLTASLQQGYVWVGNASGVSTTVATSSFGGGGALPSGLLSSSVTNFTDYSASVDSRINGIVTGTGFATTGSNSFNGDQNVTGSIRYSQQLIVGTTNLGPTIQSLDSGTPSGMTGLQVNAGESGSFSMRTLYGGTIASATMEAYNTFPNPNSGGKISAKAGGGIDLFGYGGDVILSGSNTTIQGLRYPNTDGTNGQVITTNGSGVLTFTTVSGGSGFPFTGNAVITGSLLVSGSSLNDLRVIEKILVTGSNAVIENTNGVNNQYMGVSFGGAMGVSNVSNFTEIGLALDGAQWTTNWSNGPLLYVNNTPGDTYEGVFGFQDKTNFTDGRVTVLKPLVVSAAVSIGGNTTITGSVTISGSAGTDLTVVGRQLISDPTTQFPELIISGSGENVTIGRGSLSISGSTHRNLLGPRAITIRKPSFDFPVFESVYTAQSSSFLYNYTDNLSATASYNVGVFDNSFTQDVELLLETTTTNGVQFKDIRSDTGAYTTFLKIAPNGGSNPPLEFKRAMQVTGSLSIQSGSAFFANGNKQFNVGAFSSLVTQSGSAGVSQSVNFEVTDKSEGVSIVSNSRITLANSGTYSITFSAQIKADGGQDTIWMWLKKNGTNVANTSTKLIGKNGEEAVLTVNYVVDAVANDYYELVWENLNGYADLLFEGASGNYPAIPSVILTVTQAR